MINMCLPAPAANHLVQSKNSNPMKRYYLKTEPLMKRALIISTLLAASLVTYGCANVNKIGAAPVADAHNIISSANWSQSQVIGVTLSSFEFTPTNLTLQHGQPYKLHLVNNSNDTHTFSSGDFFKAVAVQKVVQKGAETPGLTGNGISMGPNEQADLYLVAVTAGTYRIYCDEFMHDTMGMHGNVTIQ
jgi:uncharacterized cupredoxin-like copper-binding protein